MFHNKGYRWPDEISVGISEDTPGHKQSAIPLLLYSIKQVDTAIMAAVVSPTKMSLISAGDVIRKKYHFDRTYLSLSDCRREQLVQIKELIEKDRSLSWLHVHGSKDTKDRIDQLIKEYENRLQEAIVQDEKSVEDVKRRYEDFLHERDEEIRVLFQGLLQKRDSHRKES